MNKALDIPACIRDYEGGIIDEQEFLEKLPQVAELAVGDACTGSNPRPITPAEMEKIDPNTIESISVLKEKSAIENSSKHIRPALTRGKRMGR